MLYFVVFQYELKKNQQKEFENEQLQSQRRWKVLGYILFSAYGQYIL